MHNDWKLGLLRGLCEFKQHFESSMQWIGIANTQTRLLSNQRRWWESVEFRHAVLLTLLHFRYLIGRIGIFCAAHSDPHALRLKWMSLSIEFQPQGAAKRSHRQLSNDLGLSESSAVDGPIHSINMRNQIQFNIILADPVAIFSPNIQKLSKGNQRHWPSRKSNAYAQSI